MCWRTAHYLDKHGDAGHALGGAMNKVYCTELMQQVVGDCMRVVGVNALDKRFGLEKMYRDAVGFPLYDGGNVGMQRRRAWGGVIADPAFTADLIVDGEFIEFTKSMEGYGAAQTLPSDRPGGYLTERWRDAKEHCSAEQYGVRS